MSAPLEVSAGGVTHAGRVRDNNEDCLLIDAGLGLYAVFDGMGGHHAGEVASATARDTIHASLREAGGEIGREQIDAAFQAASAAVHAEAERRRARRGIGTTAVVCKLIGDGRVLLAHVGDSRAYLLRERRLQRLTADHTIVAELLTRGAISPEEALRHPYRSVLSRNLGSKSATAPDLLELELQPGDRLLLCSDGLTGFATDQAIEQTLGGAANADEAARELVELGLKGGGGDNVTAVVIEAGRAELPRRTQIIRTSGANEWWARRDAFLEAARDRGIASSPLCAVLSPDEAIAIVAGNLCEAVYRDLEQTTGIHVWTYAENLASGWLDQGGDFAVVRVLLDDLNAAAVTVVADIAGSDPQTGDLLSVAVPRALLVAELAIGGMLAARLRIVENAIVAAEAARAAAESFSESVTVPVNVPRVDPPTPEVQQCLDQALERAHVRIRAASESGELGVVLDVLARAHAAAVEHGGQLDGSIIARELFGTRALGEPAVTPLLDALDRARAIHLQSIRATKADDDVAAAALRRVAIAHRVIYAATAHMVVDIGRPIVDKLKEAGDLVAVLRGRARENERRISSRERRLDTQPGWAPPGGGE